MILCSNCCLVCCFTHRLWCLGLVCLTECCHAHLALSQHSGQPEPSMTKQHHIWRCILVDAAWSDSITWELQESSRKRSASSYRHSVMRSCRCLAVGWSQNFFEISLICDINGLVIQNPQLYKCGWEICVSVLWVLLFFLTFSVLSWCFQEKSWRDLSWSHYECKFRIIWRQSCAGFLPAFLLSGLNFQSSHQEGKSQQIFFPTLRCSLGMGSLKNASTHVPCKML